MRVGFIGLGSMGAPMAQRIIQSGDFDTVVWARREAALEPFRTGAATIAGSVAELAEGLDVLCTCVFDAAGTREILFGPGGAAPLMAQGGIVICHSTVAPQEVAEIATEAEKYGLRVLDAPVSGGSPKAEAGELVVMVGGDQATYDDALPILQTFSNQIVFLGAVGAGQQAKLLNNTMLSAHIALANDAFAVADELGLDRVGLAQILRNGSGRSYGIEMFAGAGSLDILAQTQAGPTLTKDVRLLSALIADCQAGSVLLAPAQTLVAEMSRIGGY